MTATDELDIAALNGMNKEEAVSAYETWQASLKSVNLDEVTTDEIAVKLVEYLPVEYTDEGGVKRTRRKSYVRSTTISAKVPVGVLNQLNKSQATLAKTMSDASLSKEEKGAASFGMAIEMVLAVWKLSEEDMTRERLEQGLDENEIGWLFNRFFGQRLRLLKQ